MATEKVEKVVVATTAEKTETVVKAEPVTATVAPEKLHKCRGMKDHKCRIGEETVIIERGHEYHLPGHITAILGNAGIVMKL